MRNGSVRSAGSRDNALPTIVRDLAELGHAELADEVAAFEETEADEAIRVTVFGEYSVGKSTLINALLGRYVLEATLRPTTGVPAELRHGDGDVRVRFRDGTERPVTADEADRYSNLGRENRARDEVARIIIPTNSTMLARGIILVDTPGVLDEDKQTARARREAACADILLLVLNAKKLLSRNEQNLLDWLTWELRKPVVPVINFMGREAAGREAVRERMAAFAKDLIRPFDRPWYEVDALPALRYRIGLEGWPAPCDNYAALSAALEGLTSRRASGLKMQSRAGWRASWQRRASTANAETLNELEQAESRLAETRKADIARIKAQLERVRGSLKTAREQCIGLIEPHKRAVTQLLPPAREIKEQQFGALRDQVKAAIKKAGRAIDRGANKVLAGLVGDTEIVLEPILVGEFIAFEIIITEGQAGGVRGWWDLTKDVMLPWRAPIRLLRWKFGASTRTETFRKRLCDWADRELENIRRLTAAQFDARTGKLESALEGRVEAIRKLPRASDELKRRQALRHKLDGLGAGVTAVPRAAGKNAARRRAGR